jgi:hypothetical protein
MERQERPKNPEDIGKMVERRDADHEIPKTFLGEKEGRGMKLKVYYDPEKGSYVVELMTKFEDIRDARHYKNVISPNTEDARNIFEDAANEIENTNNKIGIIAKDISYSIELLKTKK